MIFLSVMLEKLLRTRAQELNKYMKDIILAAKRSNRYGRGSYDEQYRLSKERDPNSSLGIINQKYWLLYVNSHWRNEYCGQNTYHKPRYSPNQYLGNSHNMSQTHASQSQKNTIKRDNSDLRQASKIRHYVTGIAVFTTKVLTVTSTLVVGTYTNVMHVGENTVEHSVGPTNKVASRYSLRYSPINVSVLQ